MKRPKRTALFETLGGLPAASSGDRPLADVLAFGAHPDDVEIAMGGTLAALKRRGARVVVCHLTDGEPTPTGSRSTRLKEAERAARILGLDDWMVLPLKNRELVPTLDARRRAAEVIRKVRPRLLFAPYPVDAHPDHWAASEIVQAARFWAKLTKTRLKGEPWYPHRLYFHLCTHLRLNVQPSFIVDTSDTHARKIAALRCYASQFLKKPGSRTLETIDRINRFFGVMIGCETGEPFFSRENLGVPDPRLFL